MAVPIVGNISIISLIIYFCLYLGIHIGIGYLKIQAEKEVKEKPFNEEIEQRVKWTRIAFMWWPPIAVVFIIIILYFQ